MRTAQPDKRTRLIETATKLAYGRGSERRVWRTSPRQLKCVGNVYYYFKTKEELAEAVWSGAWGVRAAREGGTT